MLADYAVRRMLRHRFAGVHVLSKLIPDTQPRKLRLVFLTRSPAVITCSLSRLDIGLKADPLSSRRGVVPSNIDLPLQSLPVSIQRYGGQSGSDTHLGKGSILHLLGCSFEFLRFNRRCPRIIDDFPCTLKVWVDFGQRGRCKFHVIQAF